MISKLEKEAGIVAIEAARVEKFTSKEELVTDMLANRDSYIPVNYDDRIKFLKDNGYELTRENLVDPSLSAKPAEDN